MSERRSPLSLPSRLARALHFPAGLALAALLTVAAGCRRGAERPVTEDGLTPVVFQLDWYPQTEYGGYYQAQQQGYYRAQGLSVQIVPGGPGVPAKDTVALGRADLGSTDGNDVLVAISRGVPLVIVAAEMQHNPQGLLFHQSHPLASFGDLAGRQLMAGPGSAWVEYLSRSRGIKFDLLPLTADLTSFLRDETMVRQCFVTQEPHFAEEKGARVGTLLIADSGYDPYRVIYTSRDFLRQHPDVVRAFVAASVRGFAELLSGDHEPAFGALAAANPLMSRDIMAYSLAAMKRLHLVEGDSARGERIGLITRERLASQLEILRSLDQLERDLQVDDVAVFDFVPAEASQAPSMK